MKKISQLFLCLFLFAFLFLFGSINIQTVHAIEYGGVGGKPANPDPNNSRSKSIFLYTLAPKESKEDGVLVVNNTEEKKTLLVYPTDSEQSSDGSFACEQLVEEKDEVGGWIKLSKDEITLEPNTNKVIKFTITIPENASVGEQNGCIMIQEKKAAPDGDNSGVSLSFRTGLRVVVTVPGEQIRNLTYQNLDVSQKDDGTIKVKSEIQNSGNVSIDTHVHVITSGFLGITYNYIDNQYPILRGETSTYNFEIPKPFWGGFFTISSEAEYDVSPDAYIGKEEGQTKKIITSNSQSTFVFPSLPALIIEILFLILMGVIIYFIFKKYKSKKLVEATWVKYKVKDNEDITSLAAKYNVPWKTLAKSNKLKAPYLLKEGDTILIPPSKAK